jgi:hypothetical protein
MFVLRVADGSQVVRPVLIQGKSGTQDFNAAMRKQRSSRVETNVNGVKTVFGCSGTINETEAGVASGYCFAFDVASNTVSAMLALTAGEVLACGWPDKAQLLMRKVSSTSSLEMGILMG